MTPAFPSVCLVILDGWGLAEPGPGNAVELAATPVFDALWAEHPHCTLTAMGESVGLPPGQMGNSEVGHLNLGAGAIVPQDLARIDAAVEDGSLASNETLREALHGAERVHLVGLVSDGGVHASERHLKALIELGGEWGIEDLVIHAFTDGRDTAPTGGARFLAEVQSWCDEVGTGRIGSVVGRYFAMDRDKRWDRTQRAYDLLVHGRAEQHVDSAPEAAQTAYERDETDEFIAPTTVGEQACVRQGDAVLAFNFRPDRMRQLTRALADPDFEEVDRGGAPPLERYVTLTRYEEGWPYPVVFAPRLPDMTMARVIADRGLRQLHVAESEKYPHVTYFFNGGEEEPYPGEERQLVPSPRDVPTYDRKPEMSAREAADAFVKGWAEHEPAFAIINFANADMVGHTGVIPAAVTAVETVDACLGRVLEAVRATGGAGIVTADHGNADHMLEPDGSPNTAHSLNPVPFIVVAPGTEELDGDGILADVSPTALALLGFDQPPEMTGRSLLG
ncbi:MAG: 2,3-bisphosphoglycerate-independent phosphoglycerate mutase [Solirubrobacterales bacterium]|nr:2,3-bisphosphoglycerate-independent phosphoglycerate mutase [Solirubrobacterales bacterium]